MTPHLASAVQSRPRTKSRDLGVHIMNYARGIQQVHLISSAAYLSKGLETAKEAFVLY